MDHNDIDTNYNTLFDNDKQIQFATNAIKSYQLDNYNSSIINNDLHYKEKNHKMLNAAVTINNNNIKRHILNIDNISKINYEMIKNVPGNIPLQNTTYGNELLDKNNDETMKKKAMDLLDIDNVKTKIFKNNLFEMNDKFIHKLPQPNASNSSLKVELSLEDQIDALYDLQNNLLKQYHSLQNVEKKWFALRETILDANIELDLFSEQDLKVLPIEIGGNSKARKNPKKIVKVKLGSINVPASHTQSAIHTLAFNRSKRLRNNNESDNIL
ncbi:hypothetical protein C6P45_000258 [Maudiozyma exigua]|uniref:Uncharacterized protein n=1 Tax=Maudiozyma exigua TaxID=34358 RepID=A0A9P6W7E7_MAUEX|nr:hypothetical protein C6P45_000258 [Kazachstania exigua]